MLKKFTPLLFLVVGCGSVSGQTKIKTQEVELTTNGDDAEIETNRTTVKTDDSSAEIRTGDVVVKSGDSSAEIRTGNVVLSTQHGEVKTAKASVKGKSVSAIECSGNQTLKIDGKSIVGDIAVKAYGNCDLTITNSQLSGKQIALHAYGNSTVMIIDSEISSKKIAIHADENADVKSKNTKISGKVLRAGNADYDSE